VRARGEPRGEDEVDNADQFPELPRTLVLHAGGLHVARRAAFIQAIGAAFFTYVHPAFYVLLAAGTMIAIRWKTGGSPNRRSITS
jgi:hypothetical protein